MLQEITAKNVLVVMLFGGFYAPASIGTLLQMPPDIQKSVISFMGFLMAAAIIGAFELSYTRTNLNSTLQRYLAHFTKFTLYSSILLLNVIAIVAIQVSEFALTKVMIMASTPIMIALILYDYWDSLRALDAIEQAP